MLKLTSAGLSLLLLGSLLAGCAGSRCACVGAGGGSNAGPSPVTPLPTEMRAERGSLSPDLSTIPAYEALDRALSPPPATGQYRVLRAEEVQCLAAANAPLAKLYASESEAVLQSGAGRRGSSAAAPTQSKLMLYRAIDERNKAAGMALELFYSLTEAEAGRDFLDRSIQEVDRATANLDQLKQSGLKVPMDRTALERQKLDWLDRRIQLHSAIRRMQGQLQQLCGFEADPATPVWPQADLTPTLAPIDVQAAIADGVANRADLGALRMLTGSLSTDTLPAVRSGMQSMGPGLGVAAITRRLLGGDSAAAAELPTRQTQLAQAQADTERTVRREIAEAAQNVETRLREIAVAKQRSDLWKQRMAELREKRQSDGVTAFDLTAVQPELIHAESDAVHRVIAWKIAQAKLKQAQGLLAFECGYRLPDGCR